MMISRSHLRCLSISWKSLITARRFSTLLLSSGSDVSTASVSAGRLRVLAPGSGYNNDATTCHFHSSPAFCTEPKQSQKQVQDYHSILSDENKARCVPKLTSEVPVRSWNDYHLKKDHSYAAVLVPLCTVDGEPSLLFTLRSSKLRKHRGQVSFPGGNADKTDRDFVHTALRETEEELGIDPASFDVWGQLNHLPGSGGRKIVYPILARTGEISLSDLRVNHDEVEETFAVSLRHLCDPTHFGTTRFRNGGEYTLPVYTGATHRIWGLTAIMVHQALSTIAPELYKFKVRHSQNFHKRSEKQSQSKKKQKVSSGADSNQNKARS
ncbi:nucleoside diphosphate-linked moiety X motif 8 [Aplysia californica]|uniref:Nucleoside diphosphate-linked moiety X motif 8 n=1 Tax=Aplysia californica TaxID=6500 RepID=A0ABM0JTJ7_APLCA|nr:nucleoside diphosphate-linked moiety X motif 8 [Aplysia californica]